MANDRNIELDNRQAFFANDSTYEKENESDLGALNETSQFNKSTYALDFVYKKNFCLFFSQLHYENIVEDGEHVVNLEITKTLDSPPNAHKALSDGDSINKDIDF